MPPAESLLSVPLGEALGGIGKRGPGNHAPLTPNVSNLASSTRPRSEDVGEELEQVAADGRPREPGSKQSCGPLSDRVSVKG
jgi:hypothetical protein